MRMHIYILIQYVKAVDRGKGEVEGEISPMVNIGNFMKYNYGGWNKAKYGTTSINEVATCNV